MEKSLFESLKLSLNEAIAYTEGKNEVRQRKITIKPLPTLNATDIKQIRQTLDMTQTLFAQLLGVSKKTIEAWEAGTNVPNGSAKRLLQLFAENPDLVKEEIFIEDDMKMA